MATRGTDINKVGNTFTIANNLTFSATDKRSSVAKKGSAIYKLFIADDFKIGIQINSSTVQYSDVAIATDSTAKICLCIDRNVSYAYVIARLTTNNVNLFKLNLSTRDLTDLGQISTLVSITPLKMLLNNQGNKILWLGSNNIQYCMDLDGGNLKSTISVGGRQTFTITSSDIVVTAGAQVFYSYSIAADNTLTQIGVYSIGTTFPDAGSMSSFSYNGNIYISWTRFSDLVRVTVCPANDISSGVSYAIQSTITSISISKFNLAYTSTDGYFGILCENNGTDRKIMWKVDLGTLALTPLRQVGSKTSGNLTGIFSDDSATYPTIATIDTGGINDDWTGSERVQISL